MFGKSVKLSAELHEKLSRAAKSLGCSSVQELTEQILEREADKLLTLPSASESPAGDAAETEELVRKLKGLGYLE